MKSITEIDIQKLHDAIERERWRLESAIDRPSVDDRKIILDALTALIEDVRPFAAKASDIVRWRTRENRVPEDTVQESFTAPYSDWRKLARWRKE